MTRLEAYRYGAFMATGLGFTWRCSVPHHNHRDLWCYRQTSRGEDAERSCRGIPRLVRVDLRNTPGVSEDTFLSALSIISTRTA